DPEGVRIAGLEGDADDGPAREGGPLLLVEARPVGGPGTAAHHAEQVGAVELPVRSEEQAVDGRPVPDRGVGDRVAVAWVDLEVGGFSGGEGAGEGEERVAALVQHPVRELEDVPSERIEESARLEHDRVTPAGGVHRGL